jgi:PEP-CTERM motif
MILKTTLALLSVATSLSAQAAIDVASPAFVYSQNFDSLSNTGTTNAWSNNSTLAGWSLFVQPAPGNAFSGNYSADNGGSSTGAFKSLGSAGSSDRALGAVGSGGAYFGSAASGAVAGWIAVAFQNTSGTVFNSFTVGFDGEQWRNGGNTSAQSMVLEYGFGGSFGTVAQWTAPGGSFDWASPVTGSTASALDGNAAANRVAGVGGTVNGNWSAGDTLWLRWTERNDVGNDHGLAIDNLSLSVTAVPEPETYALMLAGLALVAGLARRRNTGRSTHTSTPI